MQHLITVARAVEDTNFFKQGVVSSCILVNILCRFFICSFYINNYPFLANMILITQPINVACHTSLLSCLSS